MTFYFIPAWYAPHRPWANPSQPWYRGHHQGFDDTVHQLRLFAEAGQETQLLVFNDMPHLRYWLHHVDLFEMPVWSLFDDLRGIDQVSPRVVDIMALGWPEGAEFVYTPFLIVVRYQQETLAQIEFGQDGQLLWVTHFRRGQFHQRHIFDDRGFVSSIIYYQDGQEHHQDYLNLAGQWQIREFLLPDDQHVELTGHALDVMRKDTYPNMTALVTSRVASHLAGLATYPLVSETTASLSPSCLVLSAHPAHNQMVLSARTGHQVILSYWQGRSSDVSEGQVLEELWASDLIITDTLASREHLASLVNRPVYHLSPFDTRLSLGKSQRVKELIIHFVVDGLSDDDLRWFLSQVIYQMEENDQLVLSLVTYDASPEHYQAKEALIEALLAESQQPYLFLEKDDQPAVTELLPEEEPVDSRVSFKHLSSELAIQQALEFVRLIVDLGEFPDLYTQIAGISTGIPQVNRRESDFVEHLKNGYILKHETELAVALGYYLNGLANWNQALVYAVEKIEAYTSNRLVKGLLDRLNHHD